MADANKPVRPAVPVVPQDGDYPATAIDGTAAEIAARISDALVSITPKLLRRAYTVHILAALGIDAEVTND